MTEFISLGGVLGIVLLVIVVALLISCIKRSAGAGSRYRKIGGLSGDVECRSSF